MSMLTNPKVSFIVPSYNYGRYITQCVESIQNQTYHNVEILIINDGSTDNSKQVIDELAAKDNRIIAVHKINEGVSVARNVGIQKSTGDYIVFVDADDYLASDYTSYMLDIALKTNSPFVLSLNCFTRSDETQCLDDSVETISSEAATALLLSPRLIVGSWNKMFKKTLIVDNGLFFSKNLFYGEGLQFITQASQFSNIIGIGYRKVYYYRRNNYCSATTKFTIDKFLNGLESLDLIERTLKFHGSYLLNMLDWHKCQFYMGMCVQIQSSGKKNEFKGYFDSSLFYVRKHSFKILFYRGISIYKKMLLIGTCLSPKLMSFLDNHRRSVIARNSA